VPAAVTPSLVLVWGVLQTVSGLAWALGARGYPVPPASGGLSASTVLAATSPGVGGLALAATGVIAAGTAIGVRHGGSWPSRRGTAVVVWATAGVLTLLLPDAALLSAVAYTPVLLAGAPFGWPAGAGVLDAWSWTAVHQAWCLAGGLGLALVASRTRRAARAADGRRASGEPDRARLERVGHLGVAVAVVVPVVYAATRWAWALGVPLGIDADVLAEGAATGLWMAGAGLATLSLAGAALTVGLVRPWGEIVPRWVPVVGGRRVPPAVATVPAAVVAVLVTSSGLMFWRLLLAGAFDGFFAGSSWSVIGPELLWPLWGAGLGAAAWAYHHRRRGPTVHEPAELRREGA
jgi:hypothetical protein